MENARIRLLGDKARKTTIGVLLKPDQVDRYLRKLANRYPTVQHVSTEPTEDPTVMLVTIGPRTRH